MSLPFASLPLTVAQVPPVPMPNAGLALEPVGRVSVLPVPVLKGAAGLPYFW
jgi:hypothetical protein